MSLVSTTLTAFEGAPLPDAVRKAAIQVLVSGARRQAQASGPDADAAFAAEMAARPIAEHTDAANDQHYEVPAAFFEACLGPRLKYSSCLYAPGESLAQAEERALAETVAHADLRDGQDILELGCGWGSLTLWMAQRFPNSRITAVSNSRPQREFIETRCRASALTNVRVVTCDVNELELPAAQFDRVVSIEMFEHMRNYEWLMGNIASWLRPGGKLFVHIFCHRELMYPFETDGAVNWMGRYFFTGGLMPAADTLLWFQRDLRIERQWRLSGRHYQRTANLWLANQDAHRDEVRDVLRSVYGDAARVWQQRWRMFWMACAELFGYRNGNEWLVGHYRFAKPGTRKFS